MEPRRSWSCDPQLSIIFLWLCCNPQILNMYHVTDHMRPNQSPHLLSFLFYYITHKFCTSIKYNKTQRKLAGLAWFTLHHHLEMPVSLKLKPCYYIIFLFLCTAIATLLLCQQIKLFHQLSLASQRLCLPWTKFFGFISELLIINFSHGHQFSYDSGMSWIWNLSIDKLETNFK